MLSLILSFPALFAVLFGVCTVCVDMLYSYYGDINLFIRHIVGVCLPPGEKTQGPIMEIFNFRVKTWVKARARVRVRFMVRLSLCKMDEKARFPPSVFMLHNGAAILTFPLSDVVHGTKRTTPFYPVLIVTSLLRSVAHWSKSKRWSTKTAVCLLVRENQSSQSHLSCHALWCRISQLSCFCQQSFVLPATFSQTNLVSLLQ